MSERDQLQGNFPTSMAAQGLGLFVRRSGDTHSLMQDYLHGVLPEDVPRMLNRLLTALGKERPGGKAAAKRVLNWACIHIPEEVNTKHFNSVIAACASVGDAPGALALLEHLQEHAALQPDRTSYNTVMTACGKSKPPLWARAVELLEDMKRGAGTAELQPNDRSYLAAMYACAAVGQLELTLKLFEELKSTTLPPTNVAYSAVIKAAGTAGDVKLAHQLFQELQQHRE